MNEGKEQDFSSKTQKVENLQETEATSSQLDKKEESPAKTGKKGKILPKIVKQEGIRSKSKMAQNSGHKEDIQEQPVDIRLKRFLYLASEKLHFVSGIPEHYSYKMRRITFPKDIFLLEDVDSKLPIMFEAIASDPILPHKNNLIFALVAMLKTDRDKYAGSKHGMYTIALNLFRNNEDMFKFVKYFSIFDGASFPSGLKKICRQYYFRQEPKQLAKCVCEATSCFQWTHKDLLKLIHYRTHDKLMEVIIKYVLYGMEKALETANDDKDALELLDYFNLCKEFRCTKDEQRVVELIPQLDIYYIHQLPNQLIRSRVIWEKMIPRLEISELLQHLPRMYKLGLFKSGEIVAKVAEIFNDKEKILESKVQPSEVYIGLRNFEKGGRPKDPKLIKYLELTEDVDGKMKANPEYKKPDFAPKEPVRCPPPVLAAVIKALNYSFENLRPIQKRVMITVEISPSMKEPCLTTKNVNRLEAASLLVSCLLKMSKKCIVAVFNGEAITHASFEKNVQPAVVMRALTELQHNNVIWSTPIEWAKENREPIDVFIHLLGAVKSATKPESSFTDSPREAFDRYRREMNLENTRFIVNALGIHNLFFSDGCDSILDMCGFDRYSLNIIEGFCKELF